MNDFEENMTAYVRYRLEKPRRYLMLHVYFMMHPNGTL